MDFLCSLLIIDDINHLFAFIILKAAICPQLLLLLQHGFVYRTS
jgi:hypothetical protein